MSCVALNSKLYSIHTYILIVFIILVPVNYNVRPLHLSQTVKKISAYQAESAEGNTEPRLNEVQVSLAY